MRNHLRAVQLLWFFVFFLVLKAEGQTTPFLGLQIESMGLDTLYRPYDSDNPKAKLRVINTAGSNSPAGIQVSVACPQAPGAGGGLAIFPNGGPIVVLAPNETTYVSSWLRGLWESGTQITTLTQRNIVFTFSQGINTTTHTRTVYIASQNSSQPPPTGSITISGIIRLPAGVPGPANAWLGTAFWLQAQLTLSQSGGTFTFSTSINPQFSRNRTWYIRMAAGGAKDTLVRLNLTSSVNLDVTLRSAGPTPQLNYTLVPSPIVTNNGFWRGAVSESENTVALFPGQENWNMVQPCKDSVLVAQAKLYKYNYKTGALVWDHTPGWETWGGDMSRDGQYVAYVFETGRFGNCYAPQPTLRVLNGANGNLLWAKFGSIVESKECAISNANQFVAAGGQGKVALFGLVDSTTKWRVPVGDDWGQIRKLLFSSDDLYLYVGSGDNYLRKVRTSDGFVVWKAFIGGWPFVNGLSLTPNGQYIAVGTKSCDVSYIRTSDGAVMWTFETGNFEDAVVSPNGQYVAAFSGPIFSAQTGELLGRSNTSTSFFTSDSRYLVKPLNQIFLFTPSGQPLGQTNVAGITLGTFSGSQSQWSYLTSDNTNIIIAARDMGYQGGPTLPAQGILFYTGSITTPTGPPPDTIAPAPPFGLVVTDSSSKTITVKWRKNAEPDFMRYRIYRGISPNPTTKVDSSSANRNDTTKTFTGLTNGTRYYLRVSAVDSVGNESGYSGQVNAAPSDLLAPAAPQNLVVTDSTSTNIGIKWRRNTDADFLRYRIYRGTAPNPTTKVDSTTGGISDTSKNFTGLMNATRYYLRVTAVDSTGNESPYSNEVNATPADRIAPSAPGNLVVTDSSSRTIGVKWRKSTEVDFLRYRIYRGTSPSPATKVDSTSSGSSDTSRISTGLANGTRYYLRVTAVDSAGNESAYSNEVNAAPADRIAPAAPGNLVVTDSSTGKIGIKWRKNVEADFLRYRVYRGTSPNPTTKVDSTTAGIADTTKTMTGLVNGTRYYLRVTTVDSAGNESGYSNEANAAPSVMSGTEDILSQIPREYSLSQNYPNPFNPATMIRYGLPHRSFVKLEIYDVLGRFIETLVDQEQEARFHEVFWQAQVPTGIYFYRISAVGVSRTSESFVQVKKMMLLK